MILLCSILGWAEYKSIRPSQVPPAFMPVRRPSRYDRPSIPFAPDSFGDLLVRRFRLIVRCRNCLMQYDSGGDTGMAMRLRAVMILRAKEKWLNRKFRCPDCGGIMDPRAQHEAEFRRGAGWE